MFWSQFKSTKKAMRRLPISAKAVLMTRNGRVLMLRKPCGKFDLPGGRIEKGEKLFAGLRREVQEETGLVIKKFQFVASWVKDMPGEPSRLMIIFKAKLPVHHNELDVVLSEEHSWSKFVRPKRALKTNMGVGYKNAIAMSVRQKLYL